MQMYVDYTRLQ